MLAKKPIYNEEENLIIYKTTEGEYKLQEKIDKIFPKIDVYHLLAECRMKKQKILVCINLFFVFITGIGILLSV